MSLAHIFAVSSQPYNGYEGGILRLQVEVEGGWEPDMMTDDDRNGEESHVQLVELQS